MMTLRQKIQHMLTQWQGLDAGEQSARREQLVAELTRLIERSREEKSEMPARRSRGERERAA